MVLEKMTGGAWGSRKLGGVAWRIHGDGKARNSGRLLPVTQGTVVVKLSKFGADPLEP